MSKNAGLIAAIILILMFFCGCSANTDTNETTVSADNTVSESDTVNPALRLRIMGKKVALPFRFGELSNLRIDPNTVFNCTDTSIYGMLYYGDYRIGRVVLEDCQDDEEDFSDKTVSLISICPDKEFEEFDFSYLGFPLETSRDKVIEALGMPDEVNGNYILYNLDEEGHYVRLAFATNNLSIKKLTICVADSKADDESGINRFYDTLD